MEYRNLTVAHLRVLHPDVNRNIEYHVLSSYCSTNKEKINVILGFLKSLGCRVNDPDSFFVPGQFIFKNIIENGIDKTKMTVLFITKDFVKSSWCSYVANQAVWKSVVTKGKYRVIPIILESCRLPKYLRSLNCVHLWKYLRSSAVENGDVQSCIVRAGERLVKAIVSPTSSYKRIRHFGHRAIRKGRKVIMGMRDFIRRQEAKKESEFEVIPSTNPLHLLSIVKLLRHCLLSCRYDGCSFHCSGLQYARFQKHITQCRYVPVKCPHKGCIIHAKRYQIERHTEKCPFRPVQCQHDGCKKKVPLYLLDEHLAKCKRRPLPCVVDGCEESPATEEYIEHVQNCYEKKTVTKSLGQTESESFVFLTVPCVQHVPNLTELQNFLQKCKETKFYCSNEGCNEVFERKQELNNHLKSCDYKLYSCTNTFCDFVGMYGRVEYHIQVECEYRNVRCDICRREMSYKELQGHKSECDGYFKCEKCGRKVPKHGKRYHAIKDCPGLPPIQRSVSSPMSNEKTDQDEERKNLCQNKTEGPQQTVSEEIISSTDESNRSKIGKAVSAEIRSEEDSTKLPTNRAKRSVSESATSLPPDKKGVTGWRIPVEGLEKWREILKILKNRQCQNEEPSRDVSHMYS